MVHMLIDGELIQYPANLAIPNKGWIVRFNGIDYSVANVMVNIEYSAITIQLIED